MGESEVDAIRTLLASEPRPSAWEARRRRIEEVCAIWPVAEDVALEAVDCDGVPAEQSIVPGSDVAHVILFFHGGNYCSRSIRSHRRCCTSSNATIPGKIEVLLRDQADTEYHPCSARWGILWLSSTHSCV